MQRCSSSHCNNPVGTCSCGGLYHSHPTGNSFSMIFSTKPTNHYHHHHHQKTFNEFDVAYPKITSSSSSSVDCTLSLGTPSTRQTKVDKSFSDHRKSTSCVWDMFQTTKQQQQQHPNYNSSTTTTTATTRNIRSGASNNVMNNNNNTSSGSTRRCANCDTTSTPLWRNGPRGPKSLCNACGIRYKKEERRATTNNNANTTNTTNNSSNSCVNGAATTSWANHSSAQTHQRVNSTTYHPPASVGNHHHHHEFRFIEDDHHRNSTSSTSFLSWRFNVAAAAAADRPSLVHDYT